MARANHWSEDHATRQAKSRLARAQQLKKTLEVKKKDDQVAEIQSKIDDLKNELALSGATKSLPAVRKMDIAWDDFYRKAMVSRDEVQKWYEILSRNSTIATGTTAYTNTFVVTSSSGGTTHLPTTATATTATGRTMAVIKDSYYFDTMYKNEYIIREDPLTVKVRRLKEEARHLQKRLKYFARAGAYSPDQVAEIDNLDDRIEANLNDFAKLAGDSSSDRSIYDLQSKLNYVRSQLGELRKKRTLDRNTKWTLPDGAHIAIDENGNYEIFADEAKVVYKANRIREFNRYLNANDLLEEFIRYVGGLGISETEFRQLPLDAFIAWIIVRAVEQDNEVVQDEEHRALESSLRPIVQPRCRHCQATIPRERAAQRIEFCSGAHMDAFLAGAQSPALLECVGVDEFHLPIPESKEPEVFVVDEYSFAPQAKQIADIIDAEILKKITMKSAFHDQLLAELKKGA